MRRRLFTVSRRAVQDPRCSVWSSQRERATPYLRLSGAWLGGVGFAIGSKVRVSAEPGRLVLELAEPVGEVAEAGAPAAAPPPSSVSGNESRGRPGVSPRGPAGGAPARAMREGGGRCVSSR